MAETRAGWKGTTAIRMVIPTGIAAWSEREPRQRQGVASRRPGVDVATDAVVMMATVTSPVRRAAATGGILLSTIALASCGGGDDDGVSSAQKTVPDRPVRLDPGRTVALVGDARVTREDHDHWYALARASLPNQPASCARDNALGFLIRLSWVREEARALGVTITPAQLSAEYDKARRKQFPNPVSTAHSCERGRSPPATPAFRSRWRCSQRA